MAASDASVSASIVTDEVAPSAATGSTISPGSPKSMIWFCPSSSALDKAIHPSSTQNTTLHSSPSRSSVASLLNWWECRLDTVCGLSGTASPPIPESTLAAACRSSANRYSANTVESSLRRRISLIGNRNSAVSGGYRTVWPYDCVAQQAVGLLTRVNPQRGPISRQIRQQRVWAEKSGEFNGLACFGSTLCNV